MVGLIFWESKLHVQRSHLKLTKPFGMAKTCYIRQSQHFFTFFFLIAWRRGALAGWCGKVCAGAASIWLVLALWSLLQCPWGAFPMASARLDQV